MPTLEFKGKPFVYSHHLSVPFRELQVEADKFLPEKGKQPSLDDNLIIHGDNLEALKALLTDHAENAIRAGQLDLWGKTEGMTSAMLMEDTWKEDLAKAGIHYSSLLEALWR